MKVSRLIILAFFGLNAFAAETKKDSAPKIYLLNGKNIDAAEALTKAMSGQEVMRCQYVTAKVGKSASSISLVNKK